MFIHLLSLGRVPYAEALTIQQRVIAARKQGLIGDTLLLLEHPPVLTLGRNASRANILVSDEWLASHGVELHEVNRGGDVTYHGPGQLVGYPIVDLRGEWPGKRGPHLGPVDFVRLLEEALIRTCAEFGVMAKRIPKCTGVWTFGGGAREETGRNRRACIAGSHFARLRPERNHRPARLRLDRSLRHSRTAASPVLELEAAAGMEPTMEPRDSCDCAQLRPCLPAPNALV